MPAGRRLLVCALGGWLVASLGAGQLSHAQRKAEEAQSESAADAKNYDTPTSLPGGASPLEERREPPVTCAYCAEAGEAAKASREEQDLLAQMSMADAAWDMFKAAVAQTVIAFVGLVVLVFTLLYAKRAALAAEDAAKAGRLAVEEAQQTAEAARAANKISRDALILERRPWLTATIEAESVEFINDEIRVRVKLIAENLGQTPAFAVNIFPHIDFMAHSADVTNLATEIYNGAIEAAKREAARGVIVFPQTKFPSTILLRTSIARLKGNRVAPIVAGIVDYGTMFNTQRHQTSFFALISAAGGMIINRNMGNLNASDLQAENGSYGGIAT